MSELIPARADYGSMHGDIVALLEDARRAAARSVNVLMTATYWEIGRRIVEFEQGGQDRAGYGQALLKRLSADLSRRFGRGFSERNLEQMRLFYQAWPIDHISQTPSAKLPTARISQISSAISLVTKFPKPCPGILSTCRSWPKPSRCPGLRAPAIPLKLVEAT